MEKGYDKIRYLQKAEDLSLTGSEIVAIMSDKYFITGSSDGMIRIWDKENVFNLDNIVMPKPKKVLRGHTEAITDVKVMNNKKIISGSRDGTIKLWDVTTDKLIKTLIGHEGSVESIIKIDEKIIASGSSDNTIRLWDINTGIAVLSIEGHKREVNSIVKIDEERIASCSNDGTIRIWSIKDGRTCGSLVENQPICSLAKMDGDNLAYVVGEEYLKFCNISRILNKDMSLEEELFHFRKIKSIIKLGNDQLAIILSDRSIKIWDFSLKKMINRLSGNSNAIRGVIKVDKNKLVTILSDGRYKIWDIEKELDIITSECDNKNIVAIKMLDERTVACGIANGNIRIIDTSMENESKTLLTGHSNEITSIIKLNGNEIASSSSDNTIKIWDLEQGVARLTINAHLYKIRDLISLGGNRIASASNDGTIKIWDTNTGAELARYGSRSKKIITIVQINENEIASSSYDKTITIWSLKQRKQTRSLAGHSRTIAKLVKLRGNCIASFSYDGTIKIWDLSTNEIIQTINYSTEVNTIDSMPEENLLIVGFNNGDIVIYDLNELPKITTKVIANLATKIVNVQIFDRKEILFSSDSGDLGIIDIDDYDEIDSEELQLTLPVKTLLLGNSGAGKTTFAYWLENGVFNDQIRTTDGMRFFSFKSESLVEIKKNVKVNVEYNIWDFGGQPEYQLSHQQNYEGAKIIFLIVDLKLEKSNDISNYFWIDRIVSHFKNHKTAKKLAVYIIGTKAEENENNIGRLRKLQNKIKDLDYKIEVKCKIVNTKTQKNESIKEELQQNLKHEGESYNIESFDSGSHEIMRMIDILSTKQGYIFMRDLKRKLAKELSKEIYAPNKSITNELRFLKKTGKIEEVELKEENDFSTNNVYEEINEQGEMLINQLNENDDVNKLSDKEEDRLILLRPYWKNIIAKSILVAAQNNRNVIGALREENLYDLNFKVVFDEIDDEEIKNDTHLFVKARKDKKFMKNIVKSVIDVFLTCNIMYRKLGMFIFPSRFNAKNKLSYDINNYKEITDFKIVSRENIEESIAVIITNLFYSEKFKIISHLYNGVKLIDKDENTYMLLFERSDIEKEVQFSVKISVFSDIEAKREKELIALIQGIMNERLIPEFKSYRLRIEEEGVLLGTIAFDINQEILNNSYKKIKECVEEIKLDVYEEPMINSVCEDELKRTLHQIEIKIEEEKKEVYSNLNEYYSHAIEEDKKKEIIILHLSDLHFDKNTREENESYLIMDDIAKVYFEKKEKLKLTDVDYIVVSGDLSNKSEIHEYRKVCNLLNILSKECKVSSEQIIIVPGNHDYSRKITHSAYEVRYDEKFEKNKDFRINDKLYLKRIGTEWDNKFCNFSEHLYEYVYNEEFSRNPTKQLKVIIGDVGKNIKPAFFLFNTSVKIDHFNPRSTYFDTVNLINASREVNSNKFFKIAVGHHPLDFTEKVDFINALQNEYFKAYLHGHVHRDITIGYSNPQNRNSNMTLVGSGSFGADGKHMWQGIPHRYNIIKIQESDGDKQDKISIQVNTRQRENSNSHWKPSDIYYDEETDSYTNIWKNI